MVHICVFFLQIQAIGSIQNETVSLSHSIFSVSYPLQNSLLCLYCDCLQDHCLLILSSFSTENHTVTKTTQTQIYQ